MCPRRFNSSGKLCFESSCARWSRPGLAPERLELEITETSLLENREAHVGHHPPAGYPLALDDFGTGSMTYLTNFPYDKIKIDRPFAHGS